MIQPKKRALISVYDKNGIVDLAGRLVKLGYTLLSTGGTADTLRKASVPVVEIAHYTGHPEILEGRVKTLHPRVHGGILADPAKESHRADLIRSGIEPIGLVVVNLYPFESVAARADAPLDEVLEMIDIGGPTMIRAAAKNFKHVGVVVDPSDYLGILREIETDGALTEPTRRRLAAKAFAHTAAYDGAIRDALPARLGLVRAEEPPPGAESLPTRLRLDLELRQVLRYGENPHQRGALYVEPQAPATSTAAARQIQGKELSFNNLLDLDAAWRQVLEFEAPAVAIIKHNNPCGVAIGASLEEAFGKARATDPTSAFGGIVALNRPIDARAADALASLFLECVIAPGYAPESLPILARKEGLRVMEAGGGVLPYSGLDLRRITGGILAQDWDIAATDLSRARVVTRRAPTAEELKALDFAWKVARHVKSNAIILARADRTVGIGAGQMSRVDSVRLARMKAQEPTEGTVLASDAFFPFRDGLDEAARAGITAVVQPGGSVKDGEVTAAADQHGLAMILTGTRHFRH